MLSPIGVRIMDKKAMYLKLVEISEFLCKVVGVIQVLNELSIDVKNVTLNKDTISSLVGIINIIDDLNPYIINLGEELGIKVALVENVNGKAGLPILVSNTKH